MYKIKKQKIELDKNERNSTNNKNENDRLSMILSVIGRLYQFFECKCLSDKQPDEPKLPKSVKVSKQRFHVIKKVQNPKNNNWQARPIRTSLADFNESKKFLQDIRNNKITDEEALKRIENICRDLQKLLI